MKEHYAMNKNQNFDKVDFNRIMLKLSGEALLGSKEFGIDPEIVNSISLDIANVANEGIEVCIVVGGGNIFRGLSESTQQGIERSTADSMGMLATIMNSMAIQNSIEKHGVATRVLSAVPMQTICEPFIRRRAIRHLEKKRVVILAGGTGNPYFTTDTAAALRASEISANVILKATKVDGVYSDDPKKNKKAQRFKTLKYSDILAKNLKIMDGSAIALARDNKIPIIVFPINKKNAFLDAIFNKGRYTIIK